MLTGLQLVLFQLELATNMTMIMNTTVDPCVDFYEFACGNYDKVAKIPDHGASMERFSETYDRVKEELRDLFEEPDNPDDPNSTLRVKQFYRSCMNETQLEELGLTPLMELLEQYGGWPVAKGEAWNDSNYDWMRINAQMKANLDKSTIVAFDVQEDMKNSSEKKIYVDQASLGLSKREFYLEEKNKIFRDAYFEWMVSTAIQMGTSPEIARKELEEVLKLETDLAEIITRDEDRRDGDALYHPMQIGELKEKYPKLNFGTWFQTLADAGYPLNDTHVIVVSGQPYFEKLPDVLDKYSARTLANFQMWIIILEYTTELAPSQRVHYQKFFEDVAGSPLTAPRWEECVQVTTMYFGFPVGSMYVQKYSGPEIKLEAEQMVANIRKTMTATMDTLEWMDNTTKTYAQNKMDTMIQHIAYPDPDIFNETLIMLPYANVEISQDSYLKNKISLTAATIDLKYYWNLTNRSTWLGRMTDANAWYSFNRNSMIFPAAILQSTFYCPNAPDYYNYGNIGTIMGHELTHAFDDTGRQFNSDGNLELWWSEETLLEFKKGAQCFIDQYGNITDQTTGLNLNGENAQGENIADNGGLKLGYKAFQSVKQDRPLESTDRNQIHPVLSNFTEDQLFFLSFGQVWCTLYRPEALKISIIVDPHSPAKYRVNVPLQNFDQFSTAYECPMGSPMNPEKKCQIW